jgi:hypothetical protein
VRAVTLLGAVLRVDIELAGGAWWPTFHGG